MRHLHGILQVALDLHQHVLAGAAKNNRAGLGLLAIRDKRKVLLANLLHFEQSRILANVTFADLVGSRADGGAARAGNAEFKKKK